MAAELRRPHLLIPTKDGVLSFFTPPEKSQCCVPPSGHELPDLSELRLPQRSGERRGAFKASTVIWIRGHSKHKGDGGVEVQRAQPNSSGHSDLSPAMGGAQQLTPQYITVQCDRGKETKTTQTHGKRGEPPFTEARGESICCAVTAEAKPGKFHGVGRGALAPPG